MDEVPANGRTYTIETYDDLPDDERIAKLIHDARRYKFERDGAQQSVERILANAERSRADHRARMGRLWALIDHKRKTVPMNALHAALTDPLAKLAENATASPEYEGPDTEAIATEVPW